MCAQMTVDYVSSYFPHKTLPKIDSRPAYDTLKKLKKIVKADALHGHLGLVISPSEYSIITDTLTYNKPTHLRELKIEENTPLHKAIILCQLYNKNSIYFATQLQLKQH